MNFVDKIMNMLKKVVNKWDMLTIFLVVICFPWSLIYVAIKFIQEWE